MRHVLAVSLLMMLGGQADAADYISWEGETPTATNFPAKTWFSAKPNEKDKLSGGAWLTNIGERSPGSDEAFARYRVNVPQAGAYHLWVRKFWKHGPFRWRFNQNDWQVCGRDVALADNVPLRKHVGANWVSLGKVTLPAGAHTFELRLLAKEGEKLTAAFDCFVLSRNPFVPRGKLKPDERSGKAEQGFFAWEPAEDSFTSDAMLDLRDLNEYVAGQSGFIQRKGDQLTLGSGESVRLWAVNVSSGNAGADRASVDYAARKLAKLGVNAVRFHSPLFSRTGDPARLDAKKLDDLHYLIAAMKKQGIYTHLSFFFPLWFDIQPHYGIDGYDTIKNKRPFTLLYFEPRMQQIHRAWLQQLLTTPNSYTGKPLSQETAVAFVEIVNEDSLFFWTFARKSVPAAKWQALEKIYTRWLVRKYGSAEGALAAWQMQPRDVDDLASGRLGLYEAWHMTTQGLERASWPGKRKRLADQVEFLTHQQRSYYEQTARYIKTELGYGGLVTCSNWQTADARLLGPLERYTYTVGDVIDRHAYFGGKHTGDGASYSVRVGHRYEDAASVLDPRRMPVQAIQMAGYPQIITELGWPQPNRYRAEALPLSALYASVQGIDGLFHFALGSNYLVDQSIGKFQFASPAIAASSPAAALIYRRGDVPTSLAVVREKLSLRGLFNLQGSAHVTDGGMDALRQQDVPAAAQMNSNAVDSLACFVGPVVQSVGTEQEQSQADDLSEHIDREVKVITDRAGSLRWHYGKGLVVLGGSTHAAGAVGFLNKQPTIECGEIAVRSRNTFGSVLAVSLDEKPLKTANRILIQAMTEDQPYGFRAEGGVIRNLGTAPFGVREIACDLTITGRIRLAIVLDQNGYPTQKQIKISHREGQSTITLDPHTVWTVLER